MGLRTLTCHGVCPGAVDIVDDPFDGAARAVIDVEVHGGLISRASASSLVGCVIETATAHDGETGAMIAEAVAETARRHTEADTVSVTLTLDATQGDAPCASVSWHAHAGEASPDPRAADTHMSTTAAQVTHDTAGGAAPQPHAAVVSMESASPHAARIFRDVIVALDAAPNTQIDGISPLYHAMTADGNDTRTAVVALDTTMDVAALTAFLNAASRAHDGDVALHIIDIDGVDERERARIDDGGAGNRAAILAPWMEMEPDATFHGDPLAFLLASAPDAPFAGLESDHWIIGGKQ
ncbi:hypothetical protein [uncultured Bifidobacterium sp.]|uniref:hypothetical protein n=1 Tax=uncultured Bifidobacterium sp. TaxID=165187 RepID=UPI00258E132D|nr:hypothetical protein [uncultured Bifidobacterium sp.]